MFETLEEARAEILRLQGELEEKNTAAQTLSQNNEQLSKELEQVRTLNQKYFIQLSAQYQHSEPEPDEPDPVSCEDFAKTLKI